MILGHIAGVPVEEGLLPALAGAVGAGLLIARTWLTSRLPPRRDAPATRPDPPQQRSSSRGTAASSSAADTTDVDALFEH